MAAENKSSLLPTSGPGSKIGFRAAIAQAVLEQGGSIRRAAETAGISVQTAFTIKHRSYVPQEQVEPIKRTLRDQFALVADAALGNITDEKLEDSSALQLVKIARNAAEMAGLAAPSIREIYSRSLNEFVVRTDSQDPTCPQSGPTTGGGSEPT